MMVDTALQKLEASGKPVRVAMVGAGATGRAIALQLGTPVPGMRLVAIANRSAENAERAFRDAGFPRVQLSVHRAKPKSKSPAAFPSLQPILPY